MSVEREFTEVGLRDRLRAAPNEEKKRFPAPTTYRVSLHKSSTLGCGQRRLSASQSQPIRSRTDFRRIAIGVAL